MPEKRKQNIITTHSTHRDRDRDKLMMAIRLSESVAHISIYLFSSVVVKRKNIMKIDAQRMNGIAMECCGWLWLFAFDELDWNAEAKAEKNAEIY